MLLAHARACKRHGVPGDAQVCVVQAAGFERGLGCVARAEGLGLLERFVAGEAPQKAQKTHGSEERERKVATNNLEGGTNSTTTQRENTKGYREKGSEKPLSLVLPDWCFDGRSDGALT